MRAGALRPRSDPRKFGESSVGSCMLLTMLVVVAFAATYTTMNTIYARPHSMALNDALNPDLSTAEDVTASSGDNDENFCRGLKHTELWGASVKWGATNLVDTAEECCKQCRDLCPEGRSDCSCNSWVYCEDQSRCGESHKQCWLKKQTDVLRPEVHSTSPDLGWTSGIIHPFKQGVVRMETTEGTIRVQLKPNWAPYTVAYIREVLSLRHCSGCQFYRGEGLGAGWDANGNRINSKPPGPPYALLQGTLFADGIPFKPIAREAAPIVKRGHVCLIGEGPDFFISLAHHPEWAHGHTVFGEVVTEDMAVVDRLVTRPTKAAKWGEVEVREFEDALSFSLTKLKG